MASSPTCDATAAAGIKSHLKPYCKMKPPDIPSWFNQTFINRLRNSSCWRLYQQHCVPPYKGQTQDSHHTTAVTVVGFFLLIIVLLVLLFILNRRWRFGYIMSSIMRKRLNKNKVTTDRLSRQSAQCSYRMDSPEVTDLATPYCTDLHYSQRGNLVY